MSDTQRAESEAGALAALDGFFAALNGHDDDALYDDLLHVPHVRISGNGVAIWANREELEAIYLKEFYGRAGPDWRRSTLDATEVIHSSEHKVHVLIQFSRRREDGSAIATFRSLWIMVNSGGRWGSQARSSFAP